MIDGKPDPGYEGGGPEPKPLGPEGESAPPDYEQATTDEIVGYLRSQFTGHNLARLVEAILEAEGFITRRSTPGPDGGADILAGRGPLGLDEPTICVQVKATEASAA